MFPRKFFWKSFLSLVSVILISSVLFGCLLYYRLYNTTLSNLKTNLKKETDVLAELTMSSPDLLHQPQKIAGVVHTEDRITIISPDGIVLADNWAGRLGREELENHSDRPEIKTALAGKPAFSQRFSNTMQREMLYYARPIKENDRIVSVLRLSFALTTFHNQMAEVRNYLILTALFAILLSLPFAYAISRGTTKQLENLRIGANRLAAGDLSHHVAVGGSEELRELAAAFNKMADELNDRILSIQREHSQLETLLSNMVEGVLAIDRFGRAVFANKAFSEMTGLRMDKVKGKPYLEITRNDQLSNYIADILQIQLTDTKQMDFSNKQSQTLEAREIRFFDQHGEKSFSVQASRILDENGSLALIILVFHDITTIKRVEHIRKDFVANVSHELRTPLTALKGSVEVLLDGAYTDPDECKKFLEIMDKQLENIQNLVNDMLQLATVENVRTPLRREAVDLQTFISNITAVIQPLAQKKNKHLTVSLPEENLWLNIDPRQMTNALLNLLDNAIKYTDQEGKIELIIRKDENDLIFEVQDNGPGIPADQLQRIFERFYRVDKSRSREMGGTGLGLAIAKHAVENHGGTISVKSEAGHGTTFTIRLPASTIYPSMQM